MKKILVIEDEPEMRRNLVTVLRLERYQPLAAENGRAGLELARREKPDLILCDVMMPVLDGLGVLQALRADAATSLIPFIFLTAKGEKDDLRSGMNLGADDYLTKPVSKADSDIGTILGISESTVKKHLLEVFEKLGVETRSAATLRALEILGSPAAKRG